MKIAILGDCHFLVRNGSQHFNNYFEKFFSNVFIPYLKANNITIIIGLGDLMDNRKTLDIEGLKECKRYFFDELQRYNITLYSILGNHDIVYRNTLSVNSPSQVLREYSNVIVVDSPMAIDNLGIDLIPWICKDNESECMDHISNSKNPICMGHFEIENFSMYKGVECKEGLSKDIFSRYEYVFSGHYHHKSNKDNIYYVGTPYELTWMDYGDERGFHILDTDTRKLSFIENPYKMFNKIEYTEDYDFSNLSKYERSYIKVIVEKRGDNFDVFMDHLNHINPIDVSIIENLNDISSDVDVINESEDTITIMRNYIDGIKNKDLDLDKLKNFMQDLYNESVMLENL